MLELTRQTRTSPLAPDSHTLENVMHKTGPTAGPLDSSAIPPGIFALNGQSTGHLRGLHNRLQNWLDDGLVLLEDWTRLSASVQQTLKHAACDQDTLLPLLVKHGLLTEYVASRIVAGTTFGLRFGNYRVLNRLGAGGMGVVFKAEHIYMRRLAAVKILPLSPEQDPRLLQRFYSEMRAVAQLQHPNIVAAFDAGELAKPDGSGQIWHYLVMEYVPGPDLEQYVQIQGPLGVVAACDLAHQIACALAEANRHQLVHRDVKPSNVLVTSENQAKLVDFGLAMCFDKRLTEPGTVLGTLDYLAPEQARDASSVNIRADIFGLGGTMFWCLTGRMPFGSGGNMVGELANRLTKPPPSVLTYRPELPAELDAVVAKMMANNPEDRYPTPQAVQQALLPFMRSDSTEHLVFAPPGNLPPSATLSDIHTRFTQVIPTPDRAHRVLIVDDEEGVREFCRFTLQSEQLVCDEACDGLDALEKLDQHSYDLLVVDIDMPRMSGLELCQRLREQSRSNHKVILFSGQRSPDDMASLLSGAGVDDCLSKPFSAVQLRSRVQAALRLKDAQDRSDWLNHHLVAVNQELETNISARDSGLVDARNALVLALAQLVEYREDESGAHLVRIQQYSRALAEEAARLPELAGRIDEPFIKLLTCCAPLHDIGKVALPDHILLKPGKLEAEERLLMETHTTIGAEILKRVAGRHGPALVFLQMAIDIARHHHERFDGTGYPDGLAGNQIPLSARIVNIADVYDALRCRRQYKPALSNAAVVQVIETSTGQFDPLLLQAFSRCAARFDKIFQELKD
jgi:response regulator RpfG family c-di-GMP phosphodiesterase